MVIKKVVEDTLEQYDAPMTKNHWARHKKASVHLIHESPFASDRQLEDQKFQMEQNRNPQALVPTAVDKVRSELIIAKKGAGTALGTKAKVLNKFVRDASGIHTYTMVAPPKKKQIMGKEKEKFDPEIHPLMLPYRKESHRNPQMCSFGHRPSSASRTFNPGTMKVSMKPGEIVNSGAVGQGGFGLSVAVLGQLLHAPRLPYPSELMDDEETAQMKNLNQGSHSIDQSYQSNIPEISIGDIKPNTQVLSPIRSSSAGPSINDSFSIDPMITHVNANSPPLISAAQRRVMKKERHELLRGGDNDKHKKIQWDNGFHHIVHPSSEIFALKASGINSRQPLPVLERLTRFASLAVGEKQITPFCPNRQKNDQIVASGHPERVKNSISPQKDKGTYYDPTRDQFLQMKKRRETLARLKAEKNADAAYRQSIEAIPRCEYYPGDSLASMTMTGAAGSTSLVDPSFAEPSFADTEISAIPMDANDVTDENQLNRSYNSKGKRITDKNKLMKVFDTAQNGDRDVLFDHFMR